MNNKVNGKIHIRGILLTLLLVVMMATSVSYGAVENGAYEIQKYNYHAVVDKSHSYKVVQKIQVNLLSDLESINFEIPNGNYRVYNLKVEGADYKREKNESQSIISIIDADKLTKGEHTYKIEYTIREFADRDDEKDMFYFDALLPGWSKPISDLAIKVDFPSDFPWDDMQYYAGQYGVQDVDTKLNYKADSSAKIVRITGKKIPENFGITIKDQLPEGYWENALDGSWVVTTILLLAGAATLLLLIMWFIGGRDPKVKKVVQAHPIEGVSIAEIGYIFNTRVRTRDLITLIVYFATKGYLHISEYEPKKYHIIKKEYPKEEEKFVRNAYDILFEDVQDNRWIEMNELGDKLYRIKRAIEGDVAAGFSSPDMKAYTSLSRAFRIIGIIVISLIMGATCLLKYSYVYMSPNIFEGIIIVLVTAVVSNLLCRQIDRLTYADDGVNKLSIIGLSVAYLGIAAYVTISGYLMTGQLIASAALLIAALLGLFFVTIMRARATGNAKLASRFRQLRHFIYHPDAAILAENHYKDPNYYYEILPYALYFNGLDTWAISFLTVDVAEPEWYSDDIEGNAFSNIRGQATVLDYARDIRAFTRTIEDSYRSMKRRHKNK